MRWSGNRGDVEDLRGRSGGRVASLGIGGFVVLLALSLLTGNDFLSQFGGAGGAPPTQSTGTSGSAATSPEEERMADFAGAVAKDTQDAWQQILGNRYERTVIALFRDSVDSGCGFAQAATGPFYCPTDRKVYLDLGFFKELSDRFGAPGDFAQAYVIAHEFGHHVQHLLGADAAVRQGARAGANSASVALELQADCYAGVWGHVASKSGRFAAGNVELEPGDADEALRAAASIGDDRLQRMTTGHVAPDRFTHGTSAQRTEWFQRGFQSGDPRQCETTSRLTQ
jgi:predicted metalloprotease